MLLSGWGNFPKVKSDLVTPDSQKKIQALLGKSEHLIARGLGRGLWRFGITAKGCLHIEIKSIPWVRRKSRNSKL